MTRKNDKKKLALNKETVKTLNAPELSKIRGGITHNTVTRPALTGACGTNEGRLFCPFTLST